MIVIKYGGHALPKDGSFDPSLSYLASEYKKGAKIVLVHGGGPQINKELEIHGLKPEMVNGLRKTTPEVFKVVQKVLAGEVLRGIVNQLIGLGINAVGISSADGNLIRAEIINPDLGAVGDVTEINLEFLELLLKENYLPVISPIGVDNKGQGLNLNADLIAGAIAGAGRAEKVLFMTDVEGIFRDYPNPDSLITNISYEELNSIKDSFSDGMLPKVSAVLNAIKLGAKSAIVFDGRSTENLKLAFHGKVGTLVSQ